MNPPEPTISAAQVAVLAERVDQVITNHAKIEGLLMGMNASHQNQANQIAVVQERMTQAANAMIRATNIADAHGEAIENLERDISNHKTIWKIVGSCAGLALALVGVGYNEVRTLSKEQGRQDTRLTVLEFVIGGRNAPALPQKNSDATDSP